MWTRLRLPFAALAVLGACGRESPSPSSQPSAPSLQLPAPTKQPPASPEWFDFYGIQYRAPAGTNATTRDGTLPGPGGRGGVPSGVSPSVTLSMPGPRGFYLEIIKTAEPVSLEGMKYVLVGNKVGTNMAGKATSTGWELTYDMLGADASASKAHAIYSDFGGGHYQCKYAEVNCPDPQAAEAICRSMRPKAGK